jgi:hypothetical protein
MKKIVFIYKTLWLTIMCIKKQTVTHVQAVILCLCLNFFKLSTVYFSCQSQRSKKVSSSILLYMKVTTSGTLGRINVWPIFAQKLCIDFTENLIVMNLLLGNVRKFMWNCGISLRSLFHQLMRQKARPFYNFS